MSLLNPNRFRWFGGLAIAASIATAAPATADPPPKLFVTLGYELDPGLHSCPSEVEFRDSVIEQLGYNPFSGDATHHVLAEVADSESGVEGRIVWTDATGKKEGERRLASPGHDCGEVGREMVFAIAVQIQLLSSIAATAPAPAAVPSAPPAEPVVVPEKPKPVPPARKWGGALGIGPTAELGVAPSVAAGLRLFASLRFNDLSLEVGPEAILPVTMRRSDGTGFSTTTLAATAVPCGHLGRWALCAIGMLGLLMAHGFGVDDPRSPSSPIGRVGLRVAFDQPVAPRWLGAVHVDGLATLTPRTVSLNELPVWTTPTVALVVGIDLAVLLQ